MGFDIKATQSCLAIFWMASFTQNIRGAFKIKQLPVEIFIDLLDEIKLNK